MRILVTGGSGFIGTYVGERLMGGQPDAMMLNIDCVEPKLAGHAPYWRKGDILEKEALRDLVKEFRPAIVIHMAARTDPDGLTLSDYRVNTEGSANLIEAMKEAGSVERAVFYSSQYVVRPGPLAQHDRDYRPVNIYGESKSMMEEMVRQDTSFPGTWTIVRPTNIWGPWHPRYAQEFWLVVKKGRYIHPGGSAVVRAYGYVENVAEYTVRILDAPAGTVSGRTFYVGDPIADIKLWVAAFSRALTGKEPRVVPRPVLRAIALVGDAIRLAGYPFPLFSSRYKSMTQSYLVDMEPTFSTLGKPPYSLEEGVNKTVEWLRSLGGIWVR